MSTGNISKELRDMLPATSLLTTEVRPVLTPTEDGSVLVVGALPALTTWTTSFINGVKFAPGCVYLNVNPLIGTDAAGVINTGSAISPVWSAIS